MRETSVAAQIKHPGVVRYLGWGESPHGGPYLVSEYIDGRPLTDFAAVAASEFISILVSLCKTLAFVHSAGVVHGDLSPANIMMRHGGNPVLTDFGFAVSRRSNEPELKQADVPQRDTDGPQALGGTLGFAAPEQVASSLGNVGCATDIYAVGALAYWYLAGRPPHAVGNIMESLADTVAEQDVPLDKLVLSNRLDRKLAEVASAALKKVVNDRPDKVERLLAVLQS
ncbi:MAG: hypothetical protein Aurels2KO_32010 [Aureliella sp.]